MNNTLDERKGEREKEKISDENSSNLGEYYRRRIVLTIYWNFISFPKPVMMIIIIIIIEMNEVYIGNNLCVCTCVCIH